MADINFRSIRKASHEVWPAVRESLEINKKNREAVRADPRGATTAAKARAERPWNRVVSEETVWALAKEGLLVTPEEAEVIKAAKAWAQSWPKGLPPSEDTDEIEDVELYAAVQALASSLVDLDEIATAV